MEGESDITRNIVDDLHSSDIQGGQMEGKSSFTRSIIDELHSWDVHRNQMADESVFLQVSLMNFIFRISKEIKYKVKRWCFSKYH